ncbi:hypothetical protein KAZ66_04570, partial [Candidatus Woesebacteria bacterium]|nr:hypothetical protein [Candidatus Woesebacteria bacterium]
ILPTITGAISPTISLSPTLTLIPTSTASISPTLNPSISPTKTPLHCPKKYIGDADCKQDKNNKSVTILDYAIWYAEFIKGCSQDNIAGCGADADGNGDPMDANFNYPGTKYISTDTKVNVFDYAVWIQGFITENPPIATPTKTISSPPISTTVAPTHVISITPPIGAVKGIWISSDEVKLRQPSGDEWTIILKTAEKASSNAAKISNQDSNHDIDTLAMALVCVNLGRADMCTKARAAVVNAIGTEEGGRWLAVGRNLGSYIIAADLLNLYPDSDPASPGSKVGAWLAKMYTRTLPSNNDPKTLHTFRQSAWNSGSNASAQEGFAYAALSAYLKKTDGLEWSWNAYRRYVGDRTSSHHLTATDMTWQLYPNPANPGAPADKDDPVGIQDAGAAKNGCRLDGAISNDMARGAAFSCTPTFTQYPWVGLEGAVPAAVILQRAGYPAFTAANNALLRATEYLWEVRQKTGNNDWFNGTRSNEIIHLVNIAYKKSFLLNKPVSGGGRTVDFTLWTHPSGL